MEQTIQELIESILEEERKYEALRAELRLIVLLELLRRELL